MTNALHRLLSGAVILGLLAPPAALAQPAPTPKPADPAGGNDDKLYSCGKNTTQPVSVSFKPETELKDLITWVMGFTCRNFILDPRIVSTGKKVTIIAPLKMTPGSLTTIPEEGAIEFDGTDLYITTTTGVRKKVTAA